MEQFSFLLSAMAPLLDLLGIPEGQRTTAALGLLLILITVAVLVFVLVLLRLRRRPPGEEKEEAKPQAPSEETVAEPETEPEIEEERFEEPAGGPAEETPPSAAAEPEPEVEPELPAEPAPAAPEPAAEPEPELPPVRPLAPAAPVGEEAVVPAPRPAAPEAAPPRVSLFERLRSGLTKTHSAVMGRIDALLGSTQRIDADFLEELEEILITADFGMKTTQELIQSLSSRRSGGEVGKEGLLATLRAEMESRLQPKGSAWNPEAASPLVIMVVGVNGVGKTTTIGKLAAQFVRQGKKVVVGAGDTFRAAAAEQLSVWAERSGAELVRHGEGADPAAVAFDAAKAAVARQADVLILDTAGRLHTKVNLMEELKKIRRVLAREIGGAPHETLLVLDATTGQNALIQARLFQEAVEVSGVVLTKLDGTAKGGIVVAIGAELALPVRFIGIGEGIDDLRPFDPELFVEALFEPGGRERP